jgi:hypothetical protein
MVQPLMPKSGIADQKAFVPDQRRAEDVTP